MAECSHNHSQPHSHAPMNEDPKLRSRLAAIKHKILVLSGKGGVGKSTVAANLALSLAEAGKQVGLLDVDVHGPSIPTLLGLTGQTLHGTDDGILPVCPLPNLKVMSIAFALPSADEAIIWRGARKAGVIQQFLRDVEWGELDYLIVDAPPGTGDEPLTAAQLIGDPTGAIIVTTPQQVAVADVRRCITFCHEIGLPVLGVVENMSGLVCPHCNMIIDLFKTGGGRAMASELDVPFLGAIPLDPGVVQSGDSGSFLKAHANVSTAAAFQAIVAQITDIEKHTPICPSHVAQPEKCPPSACSSCGADCPSKKKQ